MVPCARRSLAHPEGALEEPPRALGGALAPGARAAARPGSIPRAHLRDRDRHGCTGMAAPLVRARADLAGFSAARSAPHVRHAAQHAEAMQRWADELDGILGQSPPLEARGATQERPAVPGGRVSRAARRLNP